MGVLSFLGISDAQPYDQYKRLRFSFVSSIVCAAVCSGALGVLYHLTGYVSLTLGFLSCSFVFFAIYLYPLLEEARKLVWTLVEASGAPDEAFDEIASSIRRIEVNDGWNEEAFKAFTACIEHTREDDSCDDSCPYFDEDSCSAAGVFEEFFKQVGPDFGDDAADRGCEAR